MRTRRPRGTRQNSTSTVASGSGASSTRAPRASSRASSIRAPSSSGKPRHRANSRQYPRRGGRRAGRGENRSETVLCRGMAFIKGLRQKKMDKTLRRGHSNTGKLPSFLSRKERGGNGLSRQRGPVLRASAKREMPRDQASGCAHFCPGSRRAARHRGDPSGSRRFIGPTSMRTILTHTFSMCYRSLVRGR
ncbi:MAG: hypothetical protein BWY88_00879 [Synergistetes bacterium ADurb.Bin520]|nr:MAG: hypothetical protein BWY88_00879 [Synergistetes bacterium ADurb.Bin520]